MSRVAARAFGSVQAPIGVQNVWEYVQNQEEILRNYFDPKDISEKYNWIVYQWIKNTAQHQAVYFQLDESNEEPNQEPNEEPKAFSVELRFDTDTKRIRLEINVVENMPNSKDLFSSVSIHQKSICDILENAGKCIESWIQYSLVFYNCVHFARRLTRMVNNKNPEKVFEDCIQHFAMMLLCYIMVKVTKSSSKLTSLFVIHFTMQKLQLITRLSYHLGQYYYKKTIASDLDTPPPSIPWVTFFSLFCILHIGLNKIFRLPTNSAETYFVWFSLKLFGLNKIFRRSTVNTVIYFCLVFFKTVLLAHAGTPTYLIVTNIGRSSRSA
eukprot:339173_1